MPWIVTSIWYSFYVAGFFWSLIVADTFILTFHCFWKRSHLQWKEHILLISSSFVCSHEMWDRAMWIWFNPFVIIFFSKTFQIWWFRYFCIVLSLNCVTRGPLWQRGQQTVHAENVSLWTSAFVPLPSLGLWTKSSCRKNHRMCLLPESRSNDHLSKTFL